MESLLAWGSALILVLSTPAFRANTSPTIILSNNVPVRLNEDTAYIRVVTERAGKIVAALKLPDSASFYRVRGVVAGQYEALNVVYSERDDRLKQLKEQQPAPVKTVEDSARKRIEEDVDAKVARLHEAYLAKLATELNPQQVDEIKDGMTYHVVEVTYHAYLERLPQLTDEQKARIMADLIEAREHAMDAESSKAKHAWFGKYKGRINNYLSSQGLEMKK